MSTELEQTKEELQRSNNEIARLEQVAAEMSALSKEINELREQAELVRGMRATIAEHESKILELTENYKKVQKWTKYLRCKSVLKLKLPGNGVAQKVQE